jgi:CubicO group peptidase (beta-lactamase class C family)
MTFNAQNLVAWHDLDTASHKAKRDKFADLGFRTISLSIYGSILNPRYAAVMVKRPILIATKSITGRSQSEYQSFFEDMAASGFGPFIITATGPRDSALFAGVFRKMEHIPLTRSNLSQQEFITLNTQQHDAGQILIWADAFGSLAERRYCAIWGANPGNIAWNIDAVEEFGAALQQRYVAMKEMGARPALLAVTPIGFMEMFVDSGIGSWNSKTGLTSAEYQEEVEANAKADRWPICVSGGRMGNVVRFAAIFASGEEISPRIFRSAGTPAVPAIDAEMEKYVRAQNVRGVALAIVKNQRLVYARGYTYAEASYPDVLPTTLFRQASISKTFCAVAVWKLIEKGELTLETTMQSVLNLKQPDGSAPKDKRFSDVQIGHLLTSTSAIKQGGVWGADKASAAAGGTLPSNGTEVARWIASLDMTGTPGDPDNVVYGNTDYFLLSLIVAKRMNASSFEAALKTLVLDPLSQTRTRGSRSLAGDQLANEARYHMTVHDPESGWRDGLFQLNCLASERTEDRRLVPEQYGTFDLEMFDGCGGLSSAVIDVARLCAMFACRTGNPVLSKDSIDNMLAAAVHATINFSPDQKGSHGFHGFDKAWNVDVAKHQVAFNKGGWLPAMGTSFIGTTGRFFYVLAKNGNTPKDFKLDWHEMLKPIVKAHDWGSGDLFPSFDMPRLPSLMMTDVQLKDVVDKFSIRDTMRQVKDSMGQSRQSLRLIKK